MTALLPGADVISLARGIPSPEMLPAATLAECGAGAIARHGAAALSYGDAAGFGSLREWIGGRHGVGADRVIVTPGSLIALNLLVGRLAPRGTRVLVEAPTYDRTLRMLRHAGADVVAVPRREDGLDLDALAAAVAAKPAPAFLYLLPTFHNPTGRTLGLAARERLVELAVAHGLTVVEDDAYGLLRVDGEAAPTVHELLCARGASELAVYLSSFSKSVAPGLRVGYVVAPEALAGALAADARALYLSPPVLAQAQLHEFLDRGELEPHLAHVRELLRGRRDALLDVFARRLPAGAAWTRPDGGYFLWLELPPPLEMAVVLSRAAGVACVPGTDFFAGEGGRNAARVSFSYPTVDAVRTGAERLADAIAATAPAAG